MKIRAKLKRQYESYVWQSNWWSIQTSVLMSPSTTLLKLQQKIFEQREPLEYFKSTPLPFCVTLYTPWVIGPRQSDLVASSRFHRCRSFLKCLDPSTSRRLLEKISYSCKSLDIARLRTLLRDPKRIQHARFPPFVPSLSSLPLFPHAPKRWCFIAKYENVSWWCRDNDLRYLISFSIEGCRFILY